MPRVASSDVRSYSLVDETWVLDQCVGLKTHAIEVAKAVGLPFCLKRFKITGLLGRLPVGVQLYVSPKRVIESIEPGQELFYRPRLIIATGRRSIPVALSLKSLTSPPCLALCVRYRSLFEPQFDLVATPMNAAVKSKGMMANFDAVYTVESTISAYDLNRPVGGISDINVVANVIRAALERRLSEE